PCLPDAVALCLGFEPCLALHPVGRRHFMSIPTSRRTQTMQKSLHPLRSLRRPIVTQGSRFGLAPWLLATITGLAVALCAAYLSAAEVTSVRAASPSNSGLLAVPPAERHTEQPKAQSPAQNDCSSPGQGSRSHLAQLIQEDLLAGGRRAGTAPKRDSTTGAT